MLRYLPLVVAAVVIGGGAIYTSIVTERFTGSVNAKAQHCAEFLKAVPRTIGVWEGEDKAVPENTREIAGAVGYVSRQYRNLETGEEVGIWLIVGHPNQAWRHTPDICYPASDFTMDKNHHFTIPVEGQEPLVCWTNKFSKTLGPGQDVTLRVFWTWYEPRMNKPVVWQAPGHAVADARSEFAGGKALYKLYFTTAARSDREEPQESVALEFAQQFVPIVNDILKLSAGTGPPPPPIDPPAGADGEASDAEASAAETATAETAGA